MNTAVRGPAHRLARPCSSRRGKRPRGPEQRGESQKPDRKAAPGLKQAAQDKNRRPRRSSAAVRKTPCVCEPQMPGSSDTRIN